MQTASGLPAASGYVSALGRAIMGRAQSRGDRPTGHDRSGARPPRG
jgi:hypothetical protein